MACSTEAGVEMLEGVGLRDLLKPANEGISSSGPLVSNLPGARGRVASAATPGMVPLSPRCEIKAGEIVAGDDPDPVSVDGRLPRARR